MKASRNTLPNIAAGGHAGHQAESVAFIPGPLALGSGPSVQRAIQFLGTGSLLPLQLNRGPPDKVITVLWAPPVGQLDLSSSPQLG